MQPSYPTRRANVYGNAYEEQAVVEVEISTQLPSKPAFQPIKIKTYTHRLHGSPDFLLLANFYLVWKWFKGFDKKLREIDLNPLPINGVRYAAIEDEPFL